MLNAAPDVALAALCAAIIAAEHLGQPGAGTTASTEAPPLNGAVQVVPPMAATVALFTAVALIYRRLRHAAAGAGNRRFWDLVTFILCAAAGILEFFLFVQPAGGMVDGGALARALAGAAVRALPAAATVTFFLAMSLIFVRVRAGEGGDEGGCAAGDGPIQAAEKLLTKTTLGAAAALIILMAVAFFTEYEKGKVVQGTSGLQSVCSVS
ncbi:hypothetical protein ACP70R_042477 [Stipagrostis hirtigluma subsp. patula]